MLYSIIKNILKPVYIFVFYSTVFSDLYIFYRLLLFVKSKEKYPLLTIIYQPRFQLVVLTYISSKQKIISII